MVRASIESSPSSPFGYESAQISTTKATKAHKKPNGQKAAVNYSATVTSVPVHCDHAST
jgi:hypothetical protein